MATAYSTLLGLALPVQGELSGTWGDMVDNGITRYVDIAVAGTVTLTNDGAVTLSLTNGDSSATNIVSSLTGAGTVSAQFAIIKVTGTLTTAKILTPPSSSRTYVVVNAATGSTVTVKASGQTGVSIAVGETAFVYFNGTDYVKVAGTVNTGVTSFQTSLSGLTPSTSTTGAVTLAGTLGTANGGTNLTSFTSGGVVYASSSSALATGSALTFDGTTATTPRLAFGGTTLPSAGTATIFGRSSDNNLYLQSGSGNGINFLDGSQNTMLTLAPTNLVFQISNAEIGRFTSTGLGIGTSSPATKLEVVESGTGGGIGGIIAATATAGGNAGYGFKTGGTNRWQIYTVGSAGSEALRFYDANNSAERMRLDASGNLGLGVTPSAWASSSYAFQLGPRASLYGRGGLTVLANNYYDNGTNSIYIATGTASDYYQTAGTHVWRTAPSGTAGNAVSFTQAMTLDASGNLGIGVTTIATPSSSRRALQISNTTSGGAIYLSNDTSEANNPRIFGAGTTQYDLGFAAGGSTGFINSYTNGTERTRISAAGGFSVGTTADPGAGAIYATGNITAYYSSDIKFKENVRDIPDALATVNAIGGKLFDWKDDYLESKGGADGYFVQKADFGVVAQDVQKVFPIAVRTREDGSLAVDYEKLGALAFAALVELTKRVEALEAK